MPRPVSRRYQPFLRELKNIAFDEKQPAALRLRAIEISVAVLSGVWEVAAGKVAAKAVRSLVAQDHIDKQLFELTDLVKEVCQRTVRVESALETPEQRQAREVDVLFARAKQEKEKLGNEEYRKIEGNCQ